ncbi:hypothetical protein DXD09_09395 [Ligilactobacillus ruminis]|uniref:Restriction endonuclease type II NotI domain-containing protein n=1 Tax=Ligilactobacillus ruminis TaxID=1623 RepID=A0A8B2Z7L6_9LACO|nr:NotI family restriction endonuclease [Ligilactobacillus ruminis]RGK44739.1 hypothetical protein DXD09_09395 [Ligilactobacillus ruminis]
MNKVNEMFGLYTNSDEFPNLREALVNQTCPYMNGAQCYKTRKSDPDTAIGTCSLCFNNVDQPILICPEPLTQDGRVFNDCLSFISSSIAGSDLYLVPEVTTSVGRIDYVLAAVRDGSPVDFVAIELQTLDTTGSIWNSRQELLLEHGYNVDEGAARSSGASLNWRMTAKTILAQLLQKSQLFASMNRNLVLICQTPLFDYMQANFNFEGVREADSRDVLHFHMYDYVSKPFGMQLKLSSMRSASLDVVESIMGQRQDNNQALQEINATISSRLKPEYLFSPVRRP